MNADTEILPLPSDMNTIPAAQTAPKPTGEHVFGFVPKLKHLLPVHRGIPGFRYLQVSKDNTWRAEQEGWLRVDNSVMYVISGPKGDAYMTLYTRGKSIPGQQVSSGRQPEAVDTLVYEITGFKPENAEVETKGLKPTTGDS